MPATDHTIAPDAKSQSETGSHLNEPLHNASPKSNDAISKSGLRSLLREPLLHFFVLAACRDGREHRGVADRRTVVAEDGACKHATDGRIKEAGCDGRI